jgi:hypothetical protein
MMEKLSDAIVASYRDCGAFMANNDQIKSMASELLQLRQRVAEMEEAARWIPVEERLPENKISVLAVSRYVDTPRLAGYDHEIDHWYWEEQYSTNPSITYWRPLPLPPQESEVE